MNERPIVTITRRGNWADVVTTFTPGAPMPPDGEYELRRCGESLADDPAALQRMVEHFKYLFGDMGRADALLLGNMAELIGAAEDDDG